MPLFKKSQEIADTVRTIFDLSPEDNDYLQDVKMHLITTILKRINVYFLFFRPS